MISFYSIQIQSVYFIAYNILYIKPRGGPIHTPMIMEMPSLELLSNVIDLFRNLIVEWKVKQNLMFMVYLNHYV